MSKFEVLFESIYDFSNGVKPMYKFSKRKHDETGAIRSHDKSPYFTHPESVAKLCMAYGGSDFETEVALAHDTIEDTGATYDDIKEKFGDKVADCVNEITNNRFEINKIGKEQYIDNELIRLSKPALFVKLCDILHNSLDYPNISQESRMRNNIKYLINNRKLDHREEELIDSISMAFKIGA